MTDRGDASGRPPGIRRALRLPRSRARIASELDDEVRFHIEMRIAELVARGLSEQDARAEALRKFGDAEDLRNYCQTIDLSHMRRMNMREWLESWSQDLRFAWRQFVRSPGFVVVTVLTLALGIGATTALFSVVNGVLFQPLPYAEPDRIVQLWEINESGNPTGLTDPNFDDIRAQSHSFSSIAEFRGGALVTVIGAGEPVRARISAVSREFFDVMGVRPLRGRTFTADEAQEGGAPAALLSYGFWQRQFAGNESILGSTLRIGERTATVIGIMPPDLDFPAATEIWYPRELEPHYASRTAHNWRAVARLADGVSLEQARGDVSAIARRLAQQYSGQIDATDASLVPLREQMVGGSRETLLMLLAASSVLLLIACANVINLMVARMATRQGEIALRLAIGAARIRLVQQCLAESLLLALAAGAIGVTLALAGVKALVALSPGNVPRVDEISVDGVVLAFAIGISVLVAIVLGLVTAWRGTRADLRSALSQAQRTHSGAGSTERLRRTLVVAQVALTLVLLISAGLLGRSFIRLITIDPGFRTGGAVVMDMSVPAEGKDAIESRARLYQDIIQRIAAMPGVTDVGGINALPLDGSGANGTFIILSGPGDLLGLANSRTIEEMSAEERTDFFAAFSSRSNDPTQSGDAQFRVVSENYFQTMGIPLVAGRLFDSRDTRTAPSAAVISQSLARAKWPGEDPLGKLIQYGNMDGDLRPYTVVGVVADVRDANLESAPRPTFYGLFRQRPDAAQGLNLVITSDGDIAPVIASARRIVRELRPDVPAQFRTMESIVARSMGSRSFILTLVAVFGGAALLLAGLGVYSVIAYLVTQREREISIRVALGARSQDIVQLVLRQGVMLAVAGIIVGAAGSIAATRLLAGFLYGTSPTDPVSFVAVIGLLATVALLASYLPARRAARVEAMGSLRAG